MLSSRVPKLKRDVANTRKATENLLMELKSLEKGLLTVHDDNQLGNMDLQKKMQAQSRTIQIVSNLMKTMQDSAKSSINKFR